MVREMVDLGFDRIELSHGIRITLVPGILRAVEDGLVRVSSTHNFCPLPTGITQAAPNLFQPSAGDLREHELWLRHTKRSIDFATQVNASALVCHLGSVGFSWFNPARRLSAYADRHPGVSLREDPRYQALLAKAQARLRKRKEPYWQRTQDTVSEVLDYAKERGVRLGIENRESFDELPLDDDLPGYLASFPPEAAIGYWHDTGHADIKESMGVSTQRAQLERLADRAIGFHLHDVSPSGQDHQPIGSGKVDFKGVSSFWRPEHLLVVELSPRVTPDGVRSSLAYLQALQ